jgi:hypothetical protein
MLLFLVLNCDLLADGMPAAAGNWELSACPARSSQSSVFISLVSERLDVRVVAQRGPGAMSDLINALHRE